MTASFVFSNILSVYLLEYVCVSLYLSVSLSDTVCLSYCVLPSGEDGNGQEGQHDPKV
jgi:hypothetical protein